MTDGEHEVRQNFPAGDVRILMARHGAAAWLAESALRTGSSPTPDGPTAVAGKLVALALAQPLGRPSVHRAWDRTQHQADPLRSPESWSRWQSRWVGQSCTAHRVEPNTRRGHCGRRKVSRMRQTQWSTPYPPKNLNGDDGVGSLDGRRCLPLIILKF